MSLARLVERGEAEANVDMFRAAPRALADALGIQAFRIADATALLMPGADDTQFNRVFGLGAVDTYRIHRTMAAMVTTARKLRAVFSKRVATRRNCLSFPMQHSTCWRWA